MTRQREIRPVPHGTVPRTAMVMAAGLGKRMRPLTATRPKPLVEVAGKALIDHVFDRLQRAGIERAVVNVHYLADTLQAHVTDRYPGIDVVISDESETAYQELVDDGAFPVHEPGPLRAGDATFHAGWTLHRARPNESGTLREVMTVIWFADGVTAAEPAARAAPQPEASKPASSTRSPSRLTSIRTRSPHAAPPAAPENDEGGACPRPRGYCRCSAKRSASTRRV